MTDCQHSHGVWVARYVDGSAVCVFAEEIDALRHAVDNSMQVEFVPYGEDAVLYRAPDGRA